MKLTGFSDEAGAPMEAQIEATKRLGWRHLDLRNVGGKPIAKVPMDEIRRLAGLLADNGLSVTCAGSAIANWSRSIDESMDADESEIEALLPRMRLLNIPAVRVMSYAPSGNDYFAPEQKVGERIRRLRLIVEAFSPEGIAVQHENCHNYGGGGWRQTLELVEAVPGLKLAFDTGNPAITPDPASGDRDRRQDPLEFFRKVREHVVAVHIKDPRFIRDKPTSIWPEADYGFPGEGDARVREIVGELVKDGYTGTLAIEPHMPVRPREGLTPEEARICQYVEYGRRLEKIIEEARRSIA